MCILNLCRNTNKAPLIDVVIFVEMTRDNRKKRQENRRIKRKKVSIKKNLSKVLLSK